MSRQDLLKTLYKKPKKTTSSTLPCTKKYNNHMLKVVNLEEYYKFLIGFWLIKEMGRVHG
jgi:hypothetical protein